ncbi:hypothetical protein KY331_01960 [Candidatus Woesearchaeota archaeon]|nr:hypothetical protein [Candidatus Woesearchaeota archaeon]
MARTTTKLNKKAQMEHFNWIFVLVAGTIILIFFITIVQKQGMISQTKLAASIRTDIAAILTGAGVTPDTTNILTMPKTPISFTCDAEGYSDFEIAKTGVNKRTPFDVIFAPDLVKGPTLVTWSREFKLPFKVMNFLYLTDAQVRYILVFNPENSFAERIEAELPDEITKEIRTSTLGIADKNNYKVKFIFFTDVDRNAASTFRTMPDKDVTAIKVSQSNIEFYKKTGAFFTLQGTTPVLKTEEDIFIYGAIFSEDKTFFECNIKKAIKRLAVVAKVFADREDEIKSLAGSGCAPYYYEGDSGRLLIAELAEFIDVCSDDPNTCQFAKINSLVYDPFGIQYNHDILITQDCPQIY